MMILPIGGNFYRRCKITYGVRGGYKRCDFGETETDGASSAVGFGAQPLEETASRST